MAVDIIARAMAANASGGGKDVDYGSVTNKPQINGVTLEGNKTASDLGIGEIIELVGTQDNPVNLYELIDSGIYKISGAYKVTESAKITVIPEPLLLIVFDNSVMYGDRLIRSGTQVYFGSDRTLDIRSRFFYSGTKFNTVFTTHRFGSLNSSDDINTNTFVSVANLATYIGNPNLANVDVLLTKLKTTDKKSLVNAINELVDIKQDKLTAGSGITIENNVISASGSGSAGITVLEGTEEAPVNLQNLTESGLYFVKNYYIPSALYAKASSDILIINSLTRTTNTMTQMAISSDSRGRFYWYSRSYNTTTKTWNKNDFPNRYNDIGQLNDDSNYYNGRAILSYYGDKTKLETTNKNDLVEAINEINSKITSGTFTTNLAEVQGYDATKTQVLKNINGQFTWIDES